MAGTNEEIRMIEVTNLTKWYGRTLAVDNISFRIESGAVVGFLGPNGAGKSTTLRILTCYLPASSGSATVEGFDVFSQSLHVRNRVGYMPEAVPLYPEMRVGEYLSWRAALRGIASAKRKAAVEQAAEKCWLLRPENMTRRRLDQLSRGYRQRVGLAYCLLHNPSVLVLDEPTIGLDPAQVREMRNLIRDLGTQHTVILSSHILAEVEQTCSDIIIIASGRIAAQGSVQELRQRVAGPERFVAEMRGGKPEEMAATVKAIGGVISVEAVAADDWTRLAIQSREHVDIRDQVAAAAIAKGYRLRELRQESGSLEDFFVQITYEQAQQRQKSASA